MNMASPATSFFINNNHHHHSSVPLSNGSGVGVNSSSSPLLKKKRKNGQVHLTLHNIKLFAMRNRALIALSLTLLLSTLLFLQFFVRDHHSASGVTSSRLSSVTTTSSNNNPNNNDYNNNNRVVEPSLYMTPLSLSPRVYEFKNFATPEECDRIIEMAKQRLQQSRLYDGKGDFSDTNTRSSQDMFFEPSETKWIDERIARATRIPAHNGESLTVIHYGPTQQYLPHFDYFLPNQDVNTDNLLKTYGNRIATFIIYLNDLPEGAGGETKFPRANVAIRPKKGDAAFFFNLLPDGTPDERSLHTGSPVIHGEKWIATKWMREKKWNYVTDYTPTFGTAAPDGGNGGDVKQAAAAGGAASANNGYTPTYGTALKDVK